MSLPLTSWQQRFLFVVLFALQGCGGAMSDDSDQSQSAGGAPMTTVAPVAAGGASPTTGGPRATGGNSYIYISGLGGVMSNTGGTYPGKGAAPSFGGANTGSTKAGVGGVVGVGGARAYGGSPAGGVYGGGGAKVTGGKSSTGGSSHSSSMGTSAVGGAPDTGDLCVLPRHPGDCDGYMLRYYFNVTHGRCEQFVYGGCGGNANRFDTLAQCENRCDTNSSLCPPDIPPADQIWQCSINSVCYYQATTGCPCSPEFGLGRADCDADPECADEADAGTVPEDLDAGDNPSIGPPVVVCTCGTPAWTCRSLRMINYYVD